MRSLKARVSCGLSGAGWSRGLSRGDPSPNFILQKASLGFLTWWPQSSKRAKIEAIRPLKSLDSELACHFHNILSVSARLKASPDLRRWGNRLYLLMGGIAVNLCSFSIIIDVKSIFVEQRKELVKEGKRTKKKEGEKVTKGKRKGRKEYFQTYWELKCRGNTQGIINSMPLKQRNNI